MDTSPVSCRTLERYYHVDGKTLEKQYKEELSGYRQWEDLPHADQWLVYPDNIGPNMSIDEVAISRGELYTVLTNRDRHGREQCLAAIVAGTKAETVIQALETIPEEKLESVEEVTLDLSDSMRLIVRRCFTKAVRVIDRFHVQKLACDAVQDVRIKYRWDAIKEHNEACAAARKRGETYEPERYQNGDTKKELLARSRYLLYKPANKWTDSQKTRARILFEHFPEIETAYSLAHSLRMNFAKATTKPAAMLNLARWYDKVERSGITHFKVIARTFQEHYSDILNFYNKRSTNAAAESFNSKIKSFRASLRGIVDEKFFLFRLTRIYACPH